MMAPAASSAAPAAKSGAFDLATLFVADKAARDEAALSLAATAKKEGVEFFSHIGLNDALVKVGLAPPIPRKPSLVATRKFLLPLTGFRL